MVCGFVKTTNENRMWERILKKGASLGLVESIIVFWIVFRSNFNEGVFGSPL
jgi:hypothetical protein